MTMSQKPRTHLDREVLVLAFVTIRGVFLDITREPERHILQDLGAPCVVCEPPRIMRQPITYWLTYWCMDGMQFDEMQMVPFADLDAAIMALHLGGFQWRD